MYLERKKPFLIRTAAVVMSLTMLAGLTTGCASQEDEYETITSTVMRPVGSGSQEGTGSTHNEASGTDGSAASSGSAVNNSDGNAGKPSGNASRPGGNTKAPNGSTSSSGGNISTPNAGNKDVETKGKTFTIVSTLLPAKESANLIVFEELFFKRVREVEKEYGVTIKIVNSVPCNAEGLAPLIKAGKQVGNVIDVETRHLQPMIAAGYLKSWDNVPGVDINNKNFVSGYTKVATIGSTHWGLSYIKPPEVRYCVVMNKNLLKSAGIDADNIYNLVKSKKWNYDTLLDYAKKVTDAGKGVYGIGGNPEYLMEMLMSGNNAKMVTIDSSGKATPTYTSKNVLEAVNFMNRITNTDKVYMTSSAMSKKTGFSFPDYTTKFCEGKIAFLFEDSWVLSGHIRSKVRSFKYGMLPVPLGPSGTEYTSSSGHARVFTVTSTNKELDFTAKIFNALAEPPAGYSGDQWWLDEIQLDYFQNDDKQSLNIYTQCLDNMSFDYGLGMGNVYDGFKNNIFGSIFWNSGKTPSAALDSMKGVYDKNITDFFNK